MAYTFPPRTWYPRDAGTFSMTPGTGLYVSLDQHRPELCSGLGICGGTERSIEFEMGKKHSGQECFKASGGAVLGS